MNDPVVQGSAVFKDSALRGFLLALALWIVGQTVLGFAAYLYESRDRNSMEGILTLIVVLNIGFAQWIYVIPAAIWLWRRRKRETLKALLISAGVMLLLTCACWGVMSTS